MHTNAKSTVRLFIEEALNRGNLSILNELISESYHYESPSEEMHGIEQLSSFVMALRNAFPDLQVRIEEQIGEGAKVCTRVSMTGTHDGDFLGIPATGKSVDIQGVIISELSDGLITKEWELLDQLRMLQQLGLAAH